MKPTAIALLILAAAAAAFGFDPTRGMRIAVVESSLRYGGPDAAVAEALDRRLCEELRTRGFDAFETRTSLEQLSRSDPSNADYYAELTGRGGASMPVAGAAVAAGSVAVDLGVVVSHVAAELRLYDGRTLELLRTFNLEKQSTSVVPIGIGAWSGHLAFSIAAPVRWIQERNAVRGIAHEAADAVARHLQQIE